MPFQTWVYHSTQDFNKICSPGVYLRNIFSDLLAFYLCCVQGSRFEGREGTDQERLIPRTEFLLILYSQTTFQKGSRQRLGGPLFLSSSSQGPSRNPDATFQRFSELLLLYIPSSMPFSQESPDLGTNVLKSQMTDDFLHLDGCLVINLPFLKWRHYFVGNS